MSTVKTQPIACTLTPGEAKNRSAWIAALNRDALLSHRREDLMIQLTYAAEARSRVREMVRNEQTCCAFLKFDLSESAHEIRLTITAPAEAREAADTLFALFVADAPESLPAPSACACSAAKIAANEPSGAKAAGAAAMTLSTGALACGACCVLPFTLPATLIASTGSLLSSFVHMHFWMTALSVLAVAGAWGWLGWQVRRTGKRPAFSTLAMMTASSLFMTISVLWPLIEKPLIRALGA
ncbi:hypothetical protein SAMN05216338_104475 [Bradyrhizobium sp. Rc2d]|uniref:hypothetical protein n=1 Tax=Bradyrhizobium sp. Rc2d TaxID=1855321 RepID=UPI00088D44B6|nr:hypothetical protein [Bradyrhizobium sp. Rc2d]SDJ27572.1 hypothetical protein SAMN05216338_104475 [Bradyrhizobium sp. Rc2d]